MYSLPICSPSAGSITGKNSTSNHGGASTNISSKKLSLDMNKVAQVDDTFIVMETTDFDEDCRSADSFKERILNTNLIINK